MPILARKCAEGEVAQVDQQHCYRSAKGGGGKAPRWLVIMDWSSLTRTGERVRSVHMQSAGAACRAIKSHVGTRWRLFNKHICTSRHWGSLVGL